MPMSNAMRTSNPLQMWNAWCSLSLQAAQLGFEAQGVMALRLMRLATPGTRGEAEARRMVTEKVAALAQAPTVAAATAVRGGNGPQVAAKVLGVYKKRVRANKRRLSR